MEPIQAQTPRLRLWDWVEDPSWQKSQDSSFADLFKRAVNDASDLQADAQRVIGSFLQGEPVELHQVMAAANEAGIALELLIEIRNKLTDAYRTVMHMQ
jgi:flagellar hook-basal body complex protein FliE